MNDDLRNLIISVLSGGAVATYNAIKKKLDKRKSDTKLSRAMQAAGTMSALYRVSKVRNLNSIKNATKELFLTTKADRFLILVATNGKNDPRIVSVIFDSFKDDEIDSDAATTYTGVIVDEPYRDMLKLSEASNSHGVVYEVSEMPDGMLKSFYTIEGVKHSLIKFMCRTPITKDDDLIVFCSIATHSEEPFSPLELATIRRISETRISRVVTRIIEEPDPKDFYNPNGNSKFTL